MGQNETNLREVVILLHGEIKKGADPRMTSRGRGQVLMLKRYLPDGFDSEVDMVFCGIGERYKEMAEIFGLPLDIVFPVFGNGNKVVMKGKKKFVVLTGGRGKPLEDYEPLDSKEVLKAVLEAENKDVILTSPEFLHALGKDGADSATAWRAIHDGVKLIKLEKIG